MGITNFICRRIKSETRKLRLKSLENLIKVVNLQSDQRKSSLTYFTNHTRLVKIIAYLIMTKEMHLEK